MLNKDTWIEHHHKLTETVCVLYTIITMQMDDAVMRNLDKLYYTIVV